MTDVWIAIVGALDSTRPDLGLRNPERGIAAACQLGAALAEKGCGLVVYSSHPTFIERHLVKGYASSERAAAESIQVIYPRRSERPAFDEQQSKPGLFKFKINFHSNWEVAFYRSLYTVDGLILIGGGQSTFVAGILATSSQLPLVALEPYGGTSEKVWGLIDPADGLIRQEEKELMAEDNQSAAWAARIVGALLEQRQRRRNRDRERIEQSRSHQWRRAAEAVTGLVLLAISLALVVWSWDESMPRGRLLTALIAAPAIAGMSASLMRGLWERVTGPPPGGARPVWIMAALGCVAGAVAGLLYSIAQLTVVLPGTDGQLPAITGRLVPFALLTGFVTGFATDAFFRRMAEREVDPIQLPAFTTPAKGP